VDSSTAGCANDELAPFSNGRRADKPKSRCEPAARTRQLISGFSALHGDAFAHAVQALQFKRYGIARRCRMAAIVPALWPETADLQRPGS
jgi:hypothetical protein